MPFGHEPKQVATSRTVLVSITGEGLFEGSPPLSVRALFYRFRAETFFQKALRKLGLRGPEQTLRDKLEITEVGGTLAEVSALWLSSPLYLEPPVMNCLLDRLPKLEWVYSQATGTEHLELSSFTERGVMVSNSGQLVSRPVAEMALACILDHAKRMPAHGQQQRARRWQSLRSSLLKDLTVAIVGTGNIGGELARLCSAVGMRTIGLSRNPARFLVQDSPYDQVLGLREDLSAVLGEADLVVLTLPLNAETAGIFAAREMQSMKREAALINVSRGPIVDEEELCRQLSRGLLGAAYIDHPSSLPPPRFSPLYRTPNLHLTHYSAANVHGVQAKAFEEFLQGVQALEEGKVPANRVA